MTRQTSDRLKYWGSIGTTAFVYAALTVFTVVCIVSPFLNE